MMRTLMAFGPPHAASDIETCPVPVGETCIWCNEQFIEGDKGFVDAGGTPQHRECWFRSIFGSVGHQKRTCSCFGGSEDDPPGMSKRQAAIAACEFNETLRRGEWHHGSMITVQGTSDGAETRSSTSTTPSTAKRGGDFAG